MQHFPKFSDYQYLDPEGIEKIVKKATHLIDELLKPVAVTEEELKSSKKNNLSCDLFKQILIPFFDIQEQVSYTWGIIGHLKNVLGDDDIRNYYEANLSSINHFFTHLNQDERIYHVCSQIKSEDNGFDRLTPTQQKIVNDLVLNFKLSGMLLSPEKKERYKKIKEELTRLSNVFSSNLVKDTDDFHWLFHDRKELKGMPSTVLERAHRAAVQNGFCKADEEGYLFNLKANSYIDFMTYQPNRDHRRKLSEAYSTRASRGDRDNAPIIDQILAKRQEIAELLGFKNYSEVVLKKNLVQESRQIFDFLNQLKNQSFLFAKEEKRALEDLFLKDVENSEKSSSNQETLQIYDLPYYSEKIKQLHYSFEEEEVKKYFPHGKVIEGLFETVKRLFGFSFKLNSSVSGWHESVKFYEIYQHNESQENSKNKIIGYLYCDLFARTGKNGGAWMDVHQSRKKIQNHNQRLDQEFKPLELFSSAKNESNLVAFSSNQFQLPTAYLVTNFSPPNEKGISLLSHREVETLFHEMGHVLHHLLTEEEYLPVSGISKVPWDGVELPSQFLENWAWEWESIQMFSCHEESGKKLPRDLFEKMTQARNFNVAIKMLFQLEYALFDMELHSHYLEHQRQGNSVQDIINQVREKISVFNYPNYHKFQNGFSHIFDGGYASGYYSYKWAEVMSADAFSLFLKKGIYNAELGEKFRKNILARGGSEDFNQLYLRFKGEPPNIDALLEQRGLKIS